MTQTTAVRVESILESHLHLIPLMVGVDGESADIGGMTEAAQKIAAEIDALTRERDEARAELAGLDAGMRFQFDRAEDYKAQRDEARAEVERLRPAAEAWEAQEAWIECQDHNGSEPHAVYMAMCAAAARARAAKETP